MIKHILTGTFNFIVFVLIQVLILNNIHLFRIATPFIYLYFIIKLPIRTHRTQVVFLSFLIGLVIDAFSNTPGMHAAACTLAGAVRAPLIRFFKGDELPGEAVPSYRLFGVGGFIRYVIAIVAIHHLMLFFIEYLTLFDPLFLLLRIAASIFLSTLLICIVEAFNIGAKRSGEF